MSGACQEEGLDGLRWQQKVEGEGGGRRGGGEAYESTAGDECFESRRPCKHVRCLKESEDDRRRRVGGSLLPGWKGKEEEEEEEEKVDEQGCA